MQYPTTEYVTKDDDGNVTSSVQVYRVTEDRAGEFVQTTGGNVQTQEGQVLVFGANPNFCDVLSADAFDETGYVDPNVSAAPEPTPDVPVNAPEDVGGDSADPNAPNADPRPVE